MDKDDAHDISMDIHELLSWYFSDKTLTAVLAELSVEQLAQEIHSYATEQNIDYPTGELVPELLWHKEQAANRIR